MKVSLLTFVPAFNREKTKRMEKETLTDREVLLLRRKLDLLLRTGKLLMESQMDDDYGECERRDTFLFKISEV